MNNSEKSLPKAMSEEAVCAAILDAKAVDIRDVDGGEEAFLYSSGNWGPGYVMVKELPSKQQTFKPLVRQLAAKLIREGVEFDNIAGNATGGMIPSWQLHGDYQDLSEREVGFVYVRGSRKEGGHRELITGLSHIPETGSDGTPASWLVVEELVNFGETTTNSIKALRQLGFIALEAATILHYAHDEVDTKLTQNDINLTYLTTLPTLLNVAEADGYYSPDAVASYREFLANPAGWQKQRGLERVER